jgi:hypothetical protein
MDPTAQLPAEVLDFIESKIDSVPHLEALLLLWESAPERWSTERIAARIYVTPDVATQILRQLVRRRLVDAPGKRDPGFAYDPAWDVTGTLMTRVAAAYRKNLVLVANIIHSKASGAVREFARAFEINKDD